MLRRLIDWARGRRDEPPLTLRNRAGGMAWIHGLAAAAGSEQLNGRAVKTVRLSGRPGFWEIEPLQPFTVTDWFSMQGVIFAPGDLVTVGAIHDDALEPWKADGVQKDEVEALYQPGPAVIEQAPA